MVSDKIVANAVGGKTARACDSCIRKRARWYCAADDAFLCQACDAVVHSANPLARRHERVRLKTASFKISGEASAENSGPSWHRGFTRKARTPRHGKQAPPKSEEQIRNPNSNPFPVVPEVGSDEYSNEENEEQLLYRVPIFDPFVGELCTSANSEATGNLGNGVDESKAVLSGYGGEGVDYLPGFLPSEMDLAEFAADVESLLGRGLENQSFGMEELGLNMIDCRDKEVKIEEEEDRSAEVVVAACHGDAEIDMMREPFELSFDYDSPATCGEEEEKLAAAAVMKINGGGDEEQDDGKKKKKMKLLRLDYEGVITAWESQGISWFSGDRPEFDPSGCWPDCMGACGTEVHHHPYGDLRGMAAHPTLGDGEREARVLRYREKRRTRLFSKKIRYEVRKLNAEKRPRMKGRFVKRASFAGPGFPVHNK